MVKLFVLVMSYQPMHPAEHQYGLVYIVSYVYRGDQNAQIWDHPYWLRKII